jgi:hypothetical protein
VRCWRLDAWQTVLAGSRVFHIKKRRENLVADIVYAWRDGSTSVSHDFTLRVSTAETHDELGWLLLPHIWKRRRSPFAAGKSGNISSQIMF